jgi:hypothetical protein
LPAKDAWLKRMVRIKIKSVGFISGPF